MLALTCCIIKLLFFPSQFLSNTSNKLLGTVSWSQMIPKQLASITSRSFCPMFSGMCADVHQRWFKSSMTHRRGGGACGGTTVRIEGCRKTMKHLFSFIFFSLFLREYVPVSSLSLLTMHHLWRPRFHVSQKSGLDRAEILLILMMLSLENCNQVSGDRFYRW